MSVTEGTRRHFYVQQNHGATLVLASSREEVLEILRERDRRLYPTAVPGLDYEEPMLDDITPIPDIAGVDDDSGFEFYDMD